MDIAVPHFVLDAKAFATHPSRRTTTIQMIMEDEDLRYFPSNIRRADFVETTLFVGPNEEDFLGHKYSFSTEDTLLDDNTMPKFEQGNMDPKEANEVNNSMTNLLSNTLINGFPIVEVFSPLDSNICQVDMLRNVKLPDSDCFLRNEQIILAVPNN